MKKIVTGAWRKKWQALQSARKFSKTVTCNNIKIKNMHKELMGLVKETSRQIIKSANFFVSYDKVQTQMTIIQFSNRI